MSPTTSFGLLRHAETLWNRQNRVQGSMDSPLTQAGREKYRRWGTFLSSPHWSWNRIICSPAPRAKESALIINEALGVDLEIIDDLREQSWGDWEGLTMEEISATLDKGLEQLTNMGWAFKPSSGESRSDVRRRVCAALDRLGDTYPGENVLIISHQGVIKSLVYAIENRQFLPDEPKLIKKNCLHTVTRNDHVWSAGTYNIDLPEPT